MSEEGKAMPGLEWESADHDDAPGDQNASSAAVVHGLWSLSHAEQGQWSVELIARDANLDEIEADSVRLGFFETEALAKEAAQEWDDAMIGERLLRQEREGSAARVLRMWADPNTTFHASTTGGTREEQREAAFQAIVRLLERSQLRPTTNVAVFWAGTEQIDGVETHSWTEGEEVDPAAAEAPWALLVGDPVAGFKVYQVLDGDDPVIEKRFANETWWAVPLLDPCPDVDDTWRTAMRSKRMPELLEALRKNIEHRPTMYGTDRDHYARRLRWLTDLIISKQDREQS